MKKSYSNQLKDPRWQKKRLEIMQRDNFTCQLCGDKETMLNVHHKEYTAKKVWDEPSDNLVTICKHCHFIIHNTSYFLQLKNRFFIDGTKIYKTPCYKISPNEFVYFVIISEHSMISLLKLYDCLYGMSISNEYHIYNESFKIISEAIVNSSKHL